MKKNIMLVMNLNGSTYKKKKKKRKEKSTYREPSYIAVLNICI